MSLTRIKSLSQARAKPVLSVLIPYYHDNPEPLITALGEHCAKRSDVEILIYDDGSNDSVLNKTAIAAVKSSEAAIELIIAAENKGRSFARNTLTEHARADWVLFLDADMRPETDTFIADYLEIISKQKADVVFGGFKVPLSSQDPDLELHRALSEVSDCLTLEDRAAAGPKYVCSSNLAVRKTVLDKEPFDPEFTGWGWEDSEWAARVFKSFRLVHADNPALHLGLESTDTLLRRFQTSGPNYMRFTRKHPELAKTLPLYRITGRLRKIPGQKLSRPLLRLIVKHGIIPVRIRLLALKLWRASWYAETAA